MALKPRGGKRETPNPTQKGSGDLKSGPKLDRIDRAEIFARPESEQEDLLEQEASENPAIRLEEPSPFRELMSEDGLEDEDDPELLGEGGEDFGSDPDGDFSEGQPGAQASEDPEDGMVGPDVPFRALGAPALIITETLLDSRTVFEIELPGNERVLTVRKGLKESWRATRNVISRQERWQRLWQIGRMIVERQRDYFESETPHEAYLRLKPLTQEDVAAALGIDTGVLSKLVGATIVQTPRFGCVPLDLFFGPPIADRSVRADVLAVHIRELLTLENAERRYTSDQLRIDLESRGVLPPTRTTTEKEQMARLIRRVMETYGVPSRPARRRRNA